MRGMAVAEGRAMEGNLKTPLVPCQIWTVLPQRAFRVTIGAKSPPAYKSKRRLVRHATGRLYRTAGSFQCYKNPPMISVLSHTNSDIRYLLDSFLYCVHRYA